MRKFSCIPIATALPIVFYVPCILFVCWAISEGILFQDIYLDIVLGFLVLFGLAMGTGLLLHTGHTVTIYQDHVVCKGNMPNSAFSVMYDNCSIGMDFHVQDGYKVWWIYLCTGPLVAYKKGKQINSVKIGNGFVRIMYRHDVYQALLEVLPKKQKIALQTAHRCADLD